MKLWLEKFTELITLTRVGGVSLSWDLDARFDNALLPLFSTYRIHSCSFYHVMLSNSVILNCKLIFQNTKDAKGQVKYLVYCMENAILNLPQGQDQMVWLIDFAGFNLGNLSIHVTKLTADVLQGHYPERLGVAILYNAPKFFEPFWKVCLYKLWAYYFIRNIGWHAQINHGPSLLTSLHRLQ